MSLRIHVVAETPDHVQVWLDTEIAACDGICIGSARTFELAVNEAVLELRSAARVLQQAELDGWQPTRFVDRGPVELKSWRAPDVDPVDVTR